MDNTKTNFNSTEVNNLIAVERYKFIQDKIKFLDTQQQGNFNVLLKIIIALATFIISALIAGSECKISLKTVEFAITSAGVALSISCFYLLGLCIATFFSWLDYRNEEVALLKKVKCNINRSTPKIYVRKIVRWNEFHFALLLIALSILGVGTFLYPEYLMGSMSNVICEK